MEIAVKLTTSILIQSKEKQEVSISLRSHSHTMTIHVLSRHLHVCMRLSLKACFNDVIVIDFTKIQQH